jgi:hypothetical protein
MDELDRLEPHELTQLAMMAFIHMYENDTIPKEQLLEDILVWFRLMTEDIIDLEIHQVMPLDDTRSH